MRVVYFSVLRFGAMCCIVLQCVSVCVVCCSQLQQVAVGRNGLVRLAGASIRSRRLLQCVAACCGALQCVAVHCSVLYCVVVCYSVLPRVAACCCVLLCVAIMCCSVFPRFAVCCCVLLCVAVCCNVLHGDMEGRGWHWDLLLLLLFRMH